MTMTSTISADALTTKPQPSSPSTSAADVRRLGRPGCLRGQELLFFGGPAERPEARTVRELKASLVCATCPVVTPVPGLGPRAR